MLLPIHRHLCAESPERTCASAHVSCQACFCKPCVLPVCCGCQANVLLCSMSNPGKHGRATR